MAKVVELAELIDFARTTSERLAEDGDNTGLATSGIEFLRRYGGADSTFYEAALLCSKALFQGDRIPAFYAAQRVGALLRGWADFVETGLTTSPPFGLAARTEAANDLMEQAESLLADGAVHVAVPVMIAGAAIEELLRGLWTTTTEPLAGQPGIVAYGEALKKAGVLDKDAVKDLVSIAGTRNIASHGHFAEISREIATVFVDRSNLFISQHRSAAS